MGATRSQKRTLIAFCELCIALYTYGVISAPCIPSHIEGIALPLDFMVGIPLGFYILVVRPRGLTLLSVIPVIWVGYGLSVIALGSPNAGVLPCLLAVLIPVEIAIAVRECLEIARVYKTAKEKSADPIAWFKETMLYLVRKDTPASMAAAELSVWYYALLSWRKKPYVLPGERVFSYHNAGGYMNMMLGLALAFPVEIIGVHVLISQWSVVAACVVTALSIYAAIWLAGDARARVMRPVAIGDGYIRLECGIQMEATIPFSDIEKICFSESEINAFAKTDKLNYGTFYQANVWVIVKHPVEVSTMLGKKRVRVVGLSLDNPVALKNSLSEQESRGQ
ncbi:hypothetical protein [Adlercreutzia sp. ZJ154]|uniref:hypothetical protein n=1 Tax=Adlercreutzia sp. ZJ154 TaxID=2709790 RepID=UPI0013EB27FE|nr:hypothetical protein [Adlercreutzia sp. ZJ154]